MKRTVNVLAINFDNVDLSETIERIGEMIEKRGCYQIGTLNPEYVVQAQTSKQLMRVIAKMSLVVPDGIGIILAAKIKGLGKLERIRGGDLVEKLAELCVKKKYKIGLVGGERGVAQKAFEALQKKFPGLKGFAQLEMRFESIEKEKPQVLLTALSFQGPIWIDQLLTKLKKKEISLVALEVGGVFNYLAGKAKKPPKIIERIGLEWLWRLITEPWRWRRQLSLMRFVWLVLRSRKN